MILVVNVVSTAAKLVHLVVKMCLPKIILKKRVSDVSRAAKLVQLVVLVKW